MGEGIALPSTKPNAPSLSPPPTLEHLCLSLKLSFLWQHLHSCPPDLHVFFSHAPNSPGPDCWSSLFLSPGSLALGHRVKRYNLSVSEERLLPPERFERDDITFFFWFFLFPSHYHSYLKLSNVNKCSHLCIFSPRIWWWPEKSPLWPLSNHSYAFFCYIDMISKEMKRKNFMPSSRYFSISRYFFLHRKNSNEFLSFHQGVLLSHRQCDSIGLE